MAFIFRNQYGRRLQVLGPAPDDQFVEDVDGEELHVLNAESTTRRVVRTGTVPSNVRDEDSTLECTVLHQRRALSERHEADWAPITEFRLSNLRAGEYAKIDMGPTQTRELFTHLAERYFDLGKLDRLLGHLGLIVLSSGELSKTQQDSVRRFVESLEGTDAVDTLLSLTQRIVESGELSNALQQLFSSSPDVARSIASAAQLETYESALSSFRNLINENQREGAYQSFLSDHPWIFGSEYSESLRRRNWVRDEQLDFMLRRSVDGYLEIVEIKRPIVEPLFSLDSSRNSYFPSRELSSTLGQVLKYIHSVDTNEFGIVANDREGVEKIRARIIIGRDSTDEGQKTALRRLNGHLHRVEVITFDQLVRIGERTLSYLRVDPFDLSR